MSNQNQNTAWVFNPLKKKYVNLFPLFEYLKQDINDIKSLIDQEDELTELIITLIPEKDAYMNREIKKTLYLAAERRKVWVAMRMSEVDQIAASAIG